MSRTFLLPLAVALAMLAASVWFYHSRQSFAWDEVSGNLQTVARMKADSLEEWREEALSEATALASRPLLGIHLNQWLAGSAERPDPQAAESLEAAKEGEFYDDIVAYDGSGAFRLSIAGRTYQNIPEIEQTVTAALQNQRTIISEPFLYEADKRLKLCVAAVIPSTDSELRPAGILVTVFDAEQRINPLLNSWPTPTKSAEAYLIEAHGDASRYLSSRRFIAQPTPFAPVLTPERRPNALDAIEAADAGSQALGGVDYRGVPVVSIAARVRGTNWFVIAEMDTSEAFSQWRSEARLIIALVVTMLFIPFLYAGTVWQRNQRKFYKDLAAAAAETERMCRVYNMLSRTNELIIHTDNQKELLDGVAQIAVDIGRFLFVWMGIPQPDGSLAPIARAGNDQGYIDAVRASTDPTNPRGRGPSGIVARTGKPVVANRFLEWPDSGPWRERARQVGVRATAVFPLFRGEQIFGTFNLYASEEDFFGEQEIKTLQDMMADISFALDNLARNEERKLALEKVREAEDLLRLQSASLQAAANGVVITDLDGNVVWANHAFTELTGYSLEEAVGRNPRVLLRSGMQPTAFYEDMWNTILAGEMWQGDLINRTKDGTLYNEHLSITPVRDTCGRTTHFVAIKQDISEQIRARRLLEESEVRFRNLIEDMDVGVVLAGSDEHVLHVNAAAIKMLGLSEPYDDALKQVRDTLIYPDGRPVPSEELPSRRAVRSRTKVNAHVLGAVNLQTGVPLWHTVTAMPRLDEAGAVATLLLTFVDVTREVTAEQELARSRDRLQRAVEAGHIGLWEWDFVAEQASFSEEWCRQLGYEPDELRHDMEEWFSRLHPEDESRVRALGARIDHLPEDHFSHEFRVKRRDGNYRWFLGTVSLKRDADGRVVQMSGANIDIDKRKQLEEEFRQAQRMESVGRLAGGVAHDFNNLLSVISGYTELALVSLPEENPLHHDLEQVQHAAQRAADLTSQLLAFSRRQILRPKVLDLNASLHSLEKMLRRLVGEDIDIELHLDPELGKTYADPGQVDQVFLNLVVNARDAMPYGGKLKISTEGVELQARQATLAEDLKPGRYVTVKVADTGVGMDSATQLRIFEPFFTTKEQGKGTGLGLAMVYGIVQQSGGTITVRSTPGKGTEFTIYLPVVGDPNGGTEEALVTDLPRGTESILLVEDEPALRELTRRTLSELGYTVTVAGSGAEALDVFPLAQPPIDLLLTDVVMPGMSGAQAAEALRAKHPGLRVLFITGYTDEAIVQHGVLEEGVQLVNKPVRAHVLAKAIRDILDAAPPKPAEKK